MNIKSGCYLVEVSVLFDRFLDDLFFEFFQSGFERITFLQTTYGRPTWFFQFNRQVRIGYEIAFTHDHHAFHDVYELSDITGIVIADQPVHYLRIQSFGGAVDKIVFFQTVQGQREYVILSFPEWWNVYWDDIQPII